MLHETSGQLTARQTPKTFSTCRTDLRAGCLFSEAPTAGSLSRRGQTNQTFVPTRDGKRWKGSGEFYRCGRAVLAAKAEVSVTAVVLHRNRRMADVTLHVLPGEENGLGQ